MNLPKPTLEMTFPCRREMLLSVLFSILLTAGVASGLAFVTVHLSGFLADNDPARPLIVNHSESEDQPEKSLEEKAEYLPSPAITPAPAAVSPPAKMSLPAAERIPVPEIEIPSMDDLAWSEESFEPWMELDAPGVKKKPTPRPAVATKTPPRKSAPTIRPPTVMPDSALVVSRSTPNYPGKARRAGLAGRVIITVTISTSGRVSDARVSKSSSHSSLDSAALRAAKKHRFVPAKNSRGQAVATQVSLPFNFQLR